MSDVRDILGVDGGAAGGASGGGKPKPKAERAKKPKGMSREAYALLDAGAAPAVPAAGVGLKDKRKVDKRRYPWAWKQFSNSARTDGLKLWHWSREDREKEHGDDYYFAQYNKAVSLVVYTDEEYTKVVESLDTGADNWTRKETDHLLELAERFDLRFVVIADRWQMAPRSIEQLKHRYYSVARALVLSRAADPREVSNHPLIREPYNVVSEQQRKRALSRALSRTQAIFEEEKRVVEEAGRIRERRKQEAERKELLRDEKGGAAAAEAAGDMAPARELPRPDEGRYMRGVWARSTAAQLQAAAGARSAKRVEQLMREYGLEEAPKTPTKAVSEAYLSLALEIIETLDMQKRLARVETELQQLRDSANAAGGIQMRMPGTGGLDVGYSLGGLGGPLRAAAGAHGAQDPAVGGSLASFSMAAAAATPSPAAGRSSSKKRKTSDDKETPRSDGKRQRKAPRLPGE